ncbi:MAG TPA: hypothetical protein VJ001_12170, partial [Rhodocyclaceae bacterium]|nr:hypothetical protein [Rhodocyclaceae bacterium]
EFDIALRTLTTPADRSDESSLAWAQRTFRTTPNVVGGTEEIPYLFGSCGSLRANPPGALGYAFPGHTLAVLDSQRQPCTNGISGASGELSLQEHDADSVHPGLSVACHNRRHANDGSGWRPTGIRAHMDDERIIWPESTPSTAPRSP